MDRPKEDQLKEVALQEEVQPQDQIQGIETLLKDQPTPVPEEKQEDLELPDSDIKRNDVETDTVEPEYEINKIIKGRYNKDGNIEYLIDLKHFPVSARRNESEINLNETAKEFVRTHDIHIIGKKSDKQVMPS